jgi:FMN phosphatase YigB (HAD superfamily)
MSDPMVKTVDGPKLTKELVAGFMYGDEGKELRSELIEKEVLSIVDKRVSEGIKTFREGHFEAEVKARLKAEMEKNGPKPLDDKDKRLQEALDKLEESNKRAAYVEMKNEIMKMANGLPEVFAEVYPGTLEEAKAYYQRVREALDKQKTEAIKGAITNSAVPKAGATASGLTLEKYRAMPQEERIKHTDEMMSLLGANR